MGVLHLHRHPAFWTPGRRAAVDRTHPLARGLTAFLPLNDPTFYNLVGPEQGAIVGNGPSITPSMVGPALAIPNAGSVQFADSPSWALNADMTISAWINVADFGNYRGIVSHTNSNKPAPFDIYLGGNDGKMWLARGDANNFKLYYSNASAPPTQSWVHVAVTSDAANTMAVFYFNAIAQSSAVAAANGSNAVGSTPVPLMIGTRGDGATQMSGQIANIKMWTRQLSAGEIQQDYQAPFDMLRPVRSGRRGLASSATAMRRPFRCVVH